MRKTIQLSSQFHLLLSEIADTAIFFDQAMQLMAHTSLVTSLNENASEMSCRHDDPQKLIKDLREHQPRRATYLMRRHLDELEESLDLAREIGRKLMCAQFSDSILPLQSGQIRRNVSKELL